MGILEKKAVAEIAKIQELPNLTIHSISSHLPAADEDAAYTQAQLKRFDDLLTEIRRNVPGKYLVHILLSAGVAEFAGSAYDMVRGGLMLYGASTNPEFQ